MRRVHLFAAVGVIGFALIAVAASLASRQSLQLWAHQPGEHDRSVRLVVEPGTSLRALAQQLARVGVVDDADRLYRLARSRLPAGCSPVAGELGVEAEATPQDIVEVLRRRCSGSEAADGR